MMMNWKGFGRKWLCPNFKVLSWYLPGGNEEHHKNLNQDSRSLGSRIEPRTSQIRSKSVNNLTAKFGIFR
jgi:hypothetical protein